VLKKFLVALCAFFIGAYFFICVYILYAKTKEYRFIIDTLSYAH